MCFLSFVKSDSPIGSTYGEVYTTPLHMVQRSWPRLRNQMLRIRGTIACVRRSAAEKTRPHTDAAATVPESCIFVEYSMTLSVLDFFVQEKGKQY